MDYSGTRPLLDFLLVGGDEAVSPVFPPLRGAAKTVTGHLQSEFREERNFWVSHTL